MPAVSNCTGASGGVGGDAEHHRQHRCPASLPTPSVLSIAARELLSTTTDITGAQHQCSRVAQHRCSVVLSTTTDITGAQHRCSRVAQHRCSVVLSTTPDTI